MGSKGGHPGPDGRGHRGDHPRGGHAGHSGMAGRRRRPPLPAGRAGPAGRVHARRGDRRAGLGSLALLSDAGHMLSDVGAIGGALWAIALAARPAAGAVDLRLEARRDLVRRRQRHHPAGGRGIVTAEAIGRLIHPPAVDGGPVIAVAAAGIAVNVAASWVLARASRSSLNVEGAFRHVLTDLYGFIGTVIAGIVIVATGFTRADAIASLVVVALMLKAAWELLRASGRILLEAAPEGMDLDQVRAHLAGPARPRPARPARLDRHLRAPRPVRAHRHRGRLLQRRARPPAARPAPGLPGRPLRRRALHLPARSRRPRRPRAWHALTAQGPAPGGGDPGLIRCPPPQRWPGWTRSGPGPEAAR